MRHCGTVVHIRQGLPLIGRNLDTVLALVIVVIDINVVTDNGARTLVRTNTFIDIKCYANIFPVEFYIFTHLSESLFFYTHFAHVLPICLSFHPFIAPSNLPLYRIHYTILLLKAVLKVSLALPTCAQNYDSVLIKTVHFNLCPVIRLQ